MKTPEHTATRVGAINTTPERTQRRVTEKIKQQGEKEVTKLARTLSHLKIEYVDVGFLKPNAYNPNRQSERDFELLLRSMEEDGFTQPILAQQNGIIIDGEHRWRAAMKLGFEKVPVVFANMTEQQMRISTLRHNRARGTEDIQLTSSLLKDLEKLGALEYARDELLLTEAEIDQLLSDTTAPDALASRAYSPAWEFVTPDSKEAREQERAFKSMEESTGARPLAGKVGANIIKDASGSASAKLSALDKELETTTDVAARQKISYATEFRVYRIALTFIGEEGEMVSQVLGSDKPSEVFYRLCEAEYKKMVQEGKAYDPDMWDADKPKVEDVFASLEVQNPEVPSEEEGR